MLVFLFVYVWSANVRVVASVPATMYVAKQRSVAV